MMLYIRWVDKKMVSYAEMLDDIAKIYPGITKLSDKPMDTSKVLLLLELLEFF